MIPSFNIGKPWHKDYLAVLSEATAQGDTAPDYSQKWKQNRLLRDLVDASIWTALDLFYVLAHNGTESYGFLNWKAPTTFRATKVGTTTFTTNDGVKGNGSTGRYSLNYAPGTNGVNWTQNNAGFFVQVKESTGATDFVCGSGDAANAKGNIFRPRSTTDSASHILNNDTVQNPSSITDGSGLWLVSRVSSTRFDIFRNGTSQVSYTTGVNTTGRTTFNIQLFCANINGGVSGFTSKTLRVYGAGSNLSGKESTLNTIWNTYFNSL